MTARVTEAELSKWVPVLFDDIEDPLATPEPSKGALVKLDAGAYVVLFYGKVSGQLTIEIPEATKDSSALLAAFFHEVPLPTSRVLWRRPDITLPNRTGRRLPGRHDKGAVEVSGRSGATKEARPKRSARRVTMPRNPK